MNTDPRLPDRFWEKVEFAKDGCWNWTGYCNQKGYGRYWYEGRAQQAHRVAYSLLVEPMPDHLEGDHLCRNRRCCNPAHIEPVTGIENMRRGKGFGQRKEVCVRGHPKTLANLMARNGKRGSCRICANEQAKERRAGVR